MARKGIISTANPELAVESIGFQRNDSYVRDLAKCFSEIMTDINDKKFNTVQDLRMSKYKNVIDEIIFNRFGIKTDVDIGTDNFGMVNIFMMNLNHSFTDLSDLYRKYDLLGDSEKALTRLKDKSGTIDLENAKVSGFFSEYVHDLWLGLRSWVSIDLTPMEGVAITTHEIGHAFTWYEYSNRVNMTNRVLSELTSELMGNNDPKKKTYILKELPLGTEITDSDIDAIINSKSKVIVGMRLFKIMGMAMKDQMGMRHYNRTTSEQMADNFAAKFGLGMDLVTGLDKVHIAFGSPSKNKYSRAFNNISELGLLISLWSVTVALYMGIVTFPIATLGLMFFGVMTLINLFNIWSSLVGETNSRRESKQYMTYDLLKDRYMRIRQQVIQELKDTSLPKDYIRTSLERVEVIDKCIATTENYRGIINIIIRMFSSSDRDAKEVIDLSRELEALANNDLYLASAKLSTINIPK